MHASMFQVRSSWYNFEHWPVRLLYVTPVRVGLYTNTYLATGSGGFWYINFRISIS